MKNTEFITKSHRLVRFQVAHREPREIQRMRALLGTGGLGGAEARVGVLRDHSVIDLTAAGVERISKLLEHPAPGEIVSALLKEKLPSYPRDLVSIMAPADQQEVWAAGVTYLRSKKARMEESDFSATAYDRVYDAPRPELFFKSLASKVSAPGAMVGIRSDATWNVPEPELALVFNSRGDLVGYTVGNDMSSRDIEGENLLYLPQAKIYNGSCALGPCLVVGPTEAEARKWKIQVSIRRGKKEVFHGETSVGQIKRSFGELRQYLFHSQVFPDGVILLTGTGVVPPDGFTLRARDRVRIEIGGIGILENEVTVV